MTGVGFKPSYAEMKFTTDLLITLNIFLFLYFYPPFNFETSSLSRHRSDTGQRQPILFRNSANASFCTTGHAPLSNTLLCEILSNCVLW